jgi:flagellar motor protein MotB
MNALKDEAANYFDELKNVDLNSDRTKDKIIAYINKQIRIIYKNLTKIDIKLVDKIKELITISFTDILKIKTNSDTLDEQFKKNINQLIQNIKQNINQFIKDKKI